jgi:hypothetical protein
MVMKGARALVAALAAALAAGLAVVVALARRASRQTGKTLPASLADVPSEAQRLASDVKSRASETVTEVRTRTANVVGKGLETIREKEAVIKQRIAGDGAEAEGLGDYAREVDNEEVGT